MNNFTPNECKPSELTLHIIRTIAYNMPTREALKANASLYVN